MEVADQAHVDPRKIPSAESEGDGEERQVPKRVVAPVDRVDDEGSIAPARDVADLLGEQIPVDPFRVQHAEYLPLGESVQLLGRGPVRAHRDHVGAVRRTAGVPHDPVDRDAHPVEHLELRRRPSDHGRRTEGELMTPSSGPTGPRPGMTLSGDAARPGDGTPVSRGRFGDRIARPRRARPRAHPSLRLRDDAHGPADLSATGAREHRRGVPLARPSRPFGNDPGPEPAPESPPRRDVGHHRGRGRADPGRAQDRPDRGVPSPLHLPGHPLGR